jgi:glycylpeptide N-tetradecanoyltransferase
VRVAVYTSSAPLPGAVGRARTFHWPLRPRRLVASGFVDVAPPFVPLYLARFGGQPWRTRTAGLRVLRPADLPAAARLLAALHGRARLGRLFGSRDALAHAALPRRGLLASYVVVCPESGRLRALLTLALSTAAPLEPAAPPPRGWRRLLPWPLRRSRPRELRAASVQLFAAEEGVDRAVLLGDVRVLARRLGCHVLTALETFQLGRALRALRFEEGEGELNFYLYNYGLAPSRSEGEAGREADEGACEAVSAGTPAVPVRSLSGGVRRPEPPARASLVLRPSEIALPSAL